MQSIATVSRSARTFLLAALTLSASLTALVLWVGAAPAAGIIKPSPIAPCTIVGTEGNDVIHGTPGNDVICGLGGHDQLYGEGGNDVVRGGAGWDRLYGGIGHDGLDGDEGPDRLKGGSGGDWFRGGPGDDHVVYWGQTKPVRIRVGNGPNDGTAGEQDDVLKDVESISGGKGDDIIVGTDNPYQGQAYKIFGNAGNDQLAGGTNLFGGEGDDSLDTTQDRVRNNMDCGPGIDSVLASLSDNVFASCEIRL